MNGESTALLKQVRVIDAKEGRDYKADILTDGDRIQAIDTQIANYPAETKIIEGEHLILGTGLVDLYSHSGEPGTETTETLYSLAASAKAGGFVEVNLLPDTIPRIDNLETLNALQQKVSQLQVKTQQPLSQLNFWTAFARSEPPQMTQLGELSEYSVGFTGQISFSELSLFKQILEYLQPLQKTIAIDISQNQLTNKGTIREGKESIRYGTIGNPAYSEASAIAAILEIITSLDTPVHIMRVSTARGVELIGNAKQRGVPVTASTTWMHLLLNTQDLATYNSNLRLEPPLGNLEDMQALQQGIKMGTLDAIAVDHQAHTYEDKTVPFDLAPPGAIGLEIALPLLWQNLVTTDILSPVQLWQALSTKPYFCLQSSPAAAIQIDTPLSQLTLFDTQQSWICNDRNTHSLSANTFFWNREIIGKVKPLLLTHNF